MKNFHDLVRLAEHYNFVVTSTTGGKHNRGSKHALGLAVDVRTRNKENTEVEAFIGKARRLGIIVHDERTKPQHQKVWSGAHLHLEIGAGTLATVREFQKLNNLTVDRIVGSLTLAALDSLF